MEIAFLPDIGYRLTHRGRSIVINSTSLGKPGTTLTDREILSSAEFWLTYASEVHSAARLPFKSVRITQAEAPVLKDNVAYKFTDDDGLGYWMRGSIKLSPPADYLVIENPLARDIREGRGLVYLQGQERSAVLAAMSGFNSLIICTSSDARKSERRVRQRKFGNRIIKIRDVTAFAQRIAELSGATRHCVRDVTYSDAKAVKAVSRCPDELVRVNGVADFKPSTFPWIAENWSDEIARLTEPASIFTKPRSFQIERERRIAFAFDTDEPAARPVADVSLTDFLEIVS